MLHVTPGNGTLAGVWQKFKCLQAQPSGAWLWISCSDSSLLTKCQMISGWLRPGCRFTVTHPFVWALWARKHHLGLIRETSKVTGRHSGQSSGSGRDRQGGLAICGMLSQHTRRLPVYSVLFKANHLTKMQKATGW